MDSTIFLDIIIKGKIAIKNHFLCGLCYKNSQVLYWETENSLIKKDKMKLTEPNIVER